MSARGTPTLVVFSHLRWGFVYQRPQHLLSRLARHHPVLYVEEPVPGEGEPWLDEYPQADGVQVLVPRTAVPDGGYADAQLPIIGSLVTRLLRERAIDDYLAWFYTPMAVPLLAALQPCGVVYDCMDELAAFRHAPAQLRERESALLAAADLVLTGGPGLYERRRHRHPNIHLMPSSVDAAHYAPAALDPHSDAARAAGAVHEGIGRPRLGYFGVIDERFDAGLLARCAQARPDWQFVMVGPIVKIDPAALPQAPNIHWVGLQPYAHLPYLVAGWDVCLMPFALNDATRFISPTKTLEYMAGEKPVVSTPVPDVISLYGHVVRIADSAPAFIAACEQALAEDGPHRRHRIAEMRMTVRCSSWDRSAERVRELLEALVDRPQQAALSAAAEGA